MHEYSSNQACFEHSNFFQTGLKGLGRYEDWFQLKDPDWFEDQAQLEGLDWWEDLVLSGDLSW